ncbi:hypothetical protein JJB98_22490 [Bradyrhizobium diazoefficiens]|nr:hypothetical protein [Bradyrhizobium diazoefficiens]QQO22505.1 hypothetical protein JJB98_22490 [Bradyrhizobium diazoefficiens]
MARSDAGDAHRLSLSEALSISESRSSQGETTIAKRFRSQSKSLFAASPRASDMGLQPSFPSAAGNLYPGEKYFYNRGTGFSACKRQSVRFGTNRRRAFTIIDGEIVGFDQSA